MRHPSRSSNSSPLPTSPLFFESASLEERFFRFHPLGNSLARGQRRGFRALRFLPFCRHSSVRTQLRSPSLVTSLGHSCPPDTPGLPFKRRFASELAPVFLTSLLLTLVFPIRSSGPKWAQWAHFFSFHLGCRLIDSFPRLPRVFFL